jgi:signal transduction histidine kinase
MFKQTQAKLLAFYSSWIGCILIVLALAFYFLISDSLAKSVSEQLDRSIQQIQQSWNKLSPLQQLDLERQIMKLKGVGADKNGSSPSKVPPERENYINYTFLPYNHFFYLFSAEGTLLAHSLRDDKLWSYFRSSLPSRSAVGDRKIMLELPDNHSFTFAQQKQADGSILYVGMEVTENHQLLQRMKWILSLASVILLLLSVAIGYRFSSSAMVPILNAYHRQQDFVADASHEIRTPLSIIRASVEILEEEKEQLSPFHQNLVTGMKNEMQRMTLLMESLLTLARSDSGSLQINRKPFNFQLLCKTSATAFRSLAAGSQVEVDMSCSEADGEWCYNGDEERLRQLLYILLDNAVKYNRPGGRVELEYTLTADTLDIRVKDTGIGIPAEELPYVFERFYRVDKARSRSTGGHGLGLSIAALVVDAHGGQIQASNRAGGGTTISVSLPLL